jgi:hypothetical protein
LVLRAHAETQEDRELIAFERTIRQLSADHFAPTEGASLTAALASARQADRRARARLHAHASIVKRQPRVNSPPSDTVRMGAGDANCRQPIVVPR